MLISIPPCCDSRRSSLAVAPAAAIVPTLAAFVLCLTLTVRAAHADDDARPNIVLIMADDMGYECVGANGGTSYSTPHLDRMAETGLRFTNAHSQPICTPTRVQIMTGLYNHRNYIRFGLLDPGATTFAHVLKQAGYTTCIAGKWQLKGGMDGPGHFGFDEYCLWQLTRRPSRYPNPGLEINGEEVDYNDGQYGPDIVSDYLCDFIERNRDRRFFVYYPMILPHWPFEPTPDSPEWDPTAEGIQRGHGRNRYFADMVTYTDKMVGKILGKLDALNLRENTLVIFTGDNGTYTGITSRMGNRKIQGGKGKTTDNGTRVPFIASWPGTVQPGVADDLLDFTDILPTLADLAGAEVLEDIPLDGYSIVPVLKGTGRSPRDSIYCWYERNGKRNKASQHVRDTRFKLYADGRFFDVQADPAETQPLDATLLDDAAAARHAAFGKALQQRQRELEQVVLPDIPE